MEIIDDANFIETLELSALDTSPVQLPVFNMSDNHQKVSDKTYRKEILRTGSINYKGNKVTFTKEDLAGVVKNFSDNALDYVPFQFVDSNNSHDGDSPLLYGGVVEKLELSDDGNSLVADMRLGADAEKIVSHNPKFGVSVKLHPDYIRETDSRYFGPTLMHVAGTHRPRITGMKGWEAIAASNGGDTVGVINLSEDGEFIDENTITKEDDTNMELTQEQITAVFASDAFKDAVGAAVKDATKDKDEEIGRLRNEVGTFSETRYSDAVKAVGTKYRNEGVPPHMVELAENLMLSFDKDERQATIELSEGDAKVQVNRVEMISKLLDSAKGYIDLSEEQGNSKGGEVTMSEQEDAAVSFLVDLAR